MTIYILHWTHNAVTETCIRSLLGQGEILVIDNGSPVPFATKMPVKVMRLEENLFMIAAFNVAMQMFPSDYYFCITNDTKAAPYYIDKLTEELDNPEVGIVAGGTNDRGAGALYVAWPGEWPTIDMEHVDNTGWGWRHDLVEKIGYPDCVGHTHRACWFSNQDYALRAHKAGYKVRGVLSAYIWHAHDGGQDYAAWKAGKDWFDEKWGGVET